MKRPQITCCLASRPQPSGSLQTMVPVPPGCPRRCGAGAGRRKRCRSRDERTTAFPARNVPDMDLGLVLVANSGPRRGDAELELPRWPGATRTAAGPPLCARTWCMITPGAVAHPSGPSSTRSPLRGYLGAHIAHRYPLRPNGPANGDSVCEEYGAVPSARTGGRRAAPCPWQGRRVRLPAAVALFPAPRVTRDVRSASRVMTCDTS
jgi:hypothetical protein